VPRFSSFLSVVIRLWRDALGDDFREVHYLDVIAVEVVRGVAKHGGAVRASHRHRGHLGGDELGEAKLVHAFFALTPLVVRDKKLGAAGSAALRVLAMVRGFRYRDPAGAKDFPRSSGEAASPRQVTRVMVGCPHHRGFKGEPRQQFCKEFCVVHYLHI
jgi:hypothetical protein